MRIAMVGMDHGSADLPVREAFSLAAEDLNRALASVRDCSGIDGCVFLSTCNRTELYLSHAGGSPPDGLHLLCDALGMDKDAYRRYFVERREGKAVLHLMRVAGGMRSSVPGDDQIVTQVRAAIEASREANASDSFLETLFRYAVTAGKRIKSSISFAKAGASVAAEAVRAAGDKLAGLAGRRALVIGGGVVGRLAAVRLIEEGSAVTMTLRRRRGGKTSAPPEGCVPVAYENRFAVMACCDLVVSATASPHFTVRLEEARALARLPVLFIDLAVPRDIEPEVGTLPGVTLWNIDDLKPPEADAERNRQYLEAEAIVAEEARRFEMWRQNRLRLARTTPGSPDFPIFVNLHGAAVLVAGGGKVAARRAGTLLRFGAAVRVAAPSLSPEMEALVGREGLTWIRKEYESGDLDGVALAVAATDSREVNRRVGLDAGERGVLVSVADRREECSFYFPAVIEGERLTAGLISADGNHALVRRAAATIREELARIDEDHTGGQPG